MTTPDSTLVSQLTKIHPLLAHDLENPFIPPDVFDFVERELEGALSFLVGLPLVEFGVSRMLGVGVRCDGRIRSGLVLKDDGLSLFDSDRFRRKAGLRVADFRFFRHRTGIITRCG